MKTATAPSDGVLVQVIIYSNHGPAVFLAQIFECLGMQARREDFKRIDDTWSRPIEVRIAVDDVDTPVENGRPGGPG
jgi:hypothetical protein